MQISLFVSLTALAAIASAQTPPTQQAVPAPSTVISNQVLSLSKDQVNSLDKGARNVYKHCTSDSGKHQDQVAQSCVELATHLRDQLKDPAAARTALERSCYLGNPVGCNELGKDFAKAGDLTSARTAWNAPPCANGPMCKVSLFDSFATASPVDLEAAEKVGLPLCDAGHDDKVCHRLAEIGSKTDFGLIAQHHKEQRIEAIKTQIGKNNDSIVVNEGLLALANASLNSATGLFQTLAAKGQVMMYESSLKDTRKQTDSLTAELQNLQGSTDGIPTGSGLGSMLAGVAMKGVAHASDVQTAGGQLTASAFVPSSTLSPQSSADTAVPSLPGAGGGDTMYDGVNAQWVRTLLSKAGPNSCAPIKAPATPKRFVCSGRDGSVYSAMNLAWAAECSAQTGHPADAAKDAQLMLDTLKTAGDMCNLGMKTTCTTDNILSCSQLPHH